MPTMKDVARAAGVKHSTVSRVVNGSPLISAATRRKVLAAIVDLGYEPNPHARRLRRQEGMKTRSDAIGLLIWRNKLEDDEPWVGQFMGSLSTYATAEAHRHNYFLLLHGYDLAAEQFLPKPVLFHKVDGVLGVIQHREVAAAIARRMPLVLINSYYEWGYPAPAVNTDIRYAMTELVRHLTEKGHRRIAYFRPPEPPEAGYSANRWHGYLDALRQFGATVPTWCTAIQEISPATHREVMARFAARLAAAVREEGVTAVMCPSDVYAWDLIMNLQHAGLSIPRDLAVTGFDDWTIPPDYHGPPPTTVRHAYKTIIQESVSLLVRMIAGENIGINEILVPPQIMYREATAQMRK